MRERAILLSHPSSRAHFFTMKCATSPLPTMELVSFGFISLANGHGPRVGRSAQLLVNEVGRSNDDV